MFRIFANNMQTSAPADYFARTANFLN